MGMKAIVKLNGTLLATGNVEMATRFLMDCVIVESSGYGKDEVFEQTSDQNKNLQLVSDLCVTTEEDNQQQFNAIAKMRAEVENVEREKKVMQSKYMREKKFHELKNKAHALGITNDQLREWLDEFEWYNLDSVKLEDK